MSKTKKISFLGLGIALYVVLGLVLQLPIFANSHLQTDLGYVAFGVYCVCFGWLGAIVGAVGWILGQIFIGLLCGIVYKKTNNKAIHIIVTVLAVFIGVGIIKTVVECYLFNIPFAVKVVKNLVASISDSITMLLGLILGYRLKRFV